MARGFSSIKDAEKKIEEKSIDFPNALWLRLPDDGDSAVVRFLEQGDEVYSYWYHDFSTYDARTGWQTKVPCLDQDDEGTPCPGCDAELKRSFQGLINVIWRDAPKFKRDEDGKVIKKNNELVIEGYEDQVAVWRGGITLFSRVLARKDVNFKGLSTRDFEVTREGSGLKTTYSVEPVLVDGESKNVPMTAADKKLAKEVYDLEKLANFVDADTFNKIIANQQNGDGNGEVDDEDVEQYLKAKPYSD